MKLINKLVYVLVLTTSFVITNLFGAQDFSALFVLLAIVIVAIPTAYDEDDEEVIEEPVTHQPEVKEKDKTPTPTISEAVIAIEKSAHTAKRRLARMMTLSGSMNGLLYAREVSFDDMFDLFVMHRAKFMPIEIDLYKIALCSGNKENELNYMIAPLMRIGVFKREEEFYKQVRLAF